MAALREWLKGYKVKIDTVGYDDDIQNAQEQLNRLEHEQQKLTNQMDNIFDLLEQGVYTLDVFQSRRGKLTLAMEEAEAKSAEIRALIAKMESSQETRSSLIPQTEELLASYDEMTNGERNRLLKEILKNRVLYVRQRGNRHRFVPQTAKTIVQVSWRDPCAGERSHHGVWDFASKYAG